MTCLKVQIHWTEPDRSDRRILNGLLLFLSLHFGFGKICVLVFFSLYRLCFPHHDSICLIISAADVYIYTFYTSQKDKNKKEKIAISTHTLFTC